ncbi:MAG: CbiX/SirB N-terminal domain-containing protein [Burkholderiaceae bacterium]|nr:CbiX/SirB N-terminal domain-containing protein [Burkholderiaceae bacterium]
MSSATLNPSSDSLILFAHGARDAAWREPVDALASRMRASGAAGRVAVAFLERMTPTLAEAVAEAVAAGARRVVVAPLFWAPGGHLRDDVPALLAGQRAEHPGVAFELWPAIGQCDAVLDAICADYLRRWGQEKKKAASGSSAGGQGGRRNT